MGFKVKVNKQAYQRCMNSAGVVDAGVFSIAAGIVIQYALGGAGYGKMGAALVVPAAAGIAVAADWTMVGICPVYGAISEYFGPKALSGAGTIEVDLF